MKIPVSIYTKIIEGPVRERERPAPSDGFEDHVPSHSQSGCRRLYDVAFATFFSLQFY